MKLTFTLVVDTETGSVEIIDASNNKVKKTLKSKTAVIPVVQDLVPKMVLDESKYVLNQSAVELMNVSPDMRLDIRYENSVPIIGTDIAFGNEGAGNKLTKSLTVRYTGKSREVLASYGTEFTIIKHPSKEGLFMLTTDDMVIPIQEEVAVGEPDELNLDELLNVEEEKPVHAFDFNLN